MDAQHIENRQATAFTLKTHRRRAHGPWYKRRSQRVTDTGSITLGQPTNTPTIEHGERLGFVASAHHLQYEHHLSFVLLGKQT